MHRGEDNRADTLALARSLDFDIHRREAVALSPIPRRCGRKLRLHGLHRREFVDRLAADGLAEHERQSAEVVDIFRRIP